MTTIEDESVVPEFAHAVRGYDRYQVDDYIERLNEWAAGAHARALDAERTVQEQAERIQSLQDRLAETDEHRPPAVDEAIRAAATRTAEMVTAAVAQADDIRRRASADADRRLDEASRQAIAIVEAARQSVAGLTEEAATARTEARARVQTVLDDVTQQAEDLRRRADETAETAVADARAEATRLVEEAEQMAAAIRAQAEDDRRDAADQVGRLEAERTEILSELGRLRGAIQSLLGGGPDHGDPVLAVATGEVDEAEIDGRDKDEAARGRPGT